MWFVLFPRERTPSMAAILERVGAARDFDVRPLDDETFTISYQGAEVVVALNTGKWVVTEAAEIADKAADRPELAARIAASDARFEIGWDLAERHRAFDAFVHVGEILETMTGGVLYDERNSTFV